MTTTLHHLSVPTPTTPLTVLLDGDTVVASGFGSAEQLRERLPEPADLVAAPADHPVGTALRAWLDGDEGALDRVEVSQPGTDFQQQVWAALRAIPAGRTRSYGEVAAAVGRPGASRALPPCPAGGRRHRRLRVGRRRQALAAGRRGLGDDLIRPTTAAQRQTAAPPVRDGAAVRVQKDAG